MSLTYSLLRSLGLSGLGIALLIASSGPVQPQPVPAEPPALPVALVAALAPEDPLPTAADLATLMIQRGSPVLDLERDARARLGDQRRGETTDQIQAAIDAFSFPGLPFGQKVITVTGVYYTDRPLFLDASDVHLVGDGQSTISGFHGSTVIYVGVPRNPRGQTLTEDHIYDLCGALDATAAPTPGRKWGLRFHGDSHAAFGASGFSADADSASCLTIEYAIDTTESGNRIGPLFGLESYGSPAPYQLFRMDDYQGGTRTAIMFRTADDRNHLAYAPDPPPGVHRYAVQIDTTTARLQVWIDGQAVTVDRGGLATWDPGVLLASNDDVLPFKINSCGPRANWFGSDWWSYAPSAIGGLDFGLCGLRVSDVLRYQNLCDLTRIDGQAVTDQASYFTKDPGTVALLPLDQTPGDLAAHRSVASWDRGWFGLSHGLLMSDGHGSEWSAIKDNSLTGLRINNYGGHDNRFGEAVTLGFALHLTIERCVLGGGYHGLGTWGWGANYITKCFASSFSGSDAAVYSYYGMQEFTDCLIPSNGRHLFRLNVSSCHIDKLFCEDGSAALVRSFFDVNESELNIREIKIDNESGNGPGVAVFTAATGTKSGRPNGGMISIDGMDLAFPREDVPIFLLKGSPTATLGLISLTGKCVVLGERTAPFIQADPDSWAGSVTVTPGTRISGVGLTIADPSSLVQLVYPVVK